LSARPAFRFAAALAAVAASPACDLVRPLEVDPDVASVAILLVAGEREARLIAVHPHRQPGEAAPTLTATLKGQGWTAVFSQAPELQTCTRTYAHDWPGPARCLHAVLPQEIRGGEKYEIEGTAPLGAFSGEVVLPAAPVLIEPEDGLHLPMPAEDEDLLIPVRYRTGTDVGTLLAHLVVLEMEEDGTETEIDLCCIPLEPLEGRTRLVISSDVRPLLLSLRMRILGIGWNYTNVLENEGIFPLPRPWPSFGIEAEGEGVYGYFDGVVPSRVSRVWVR